MNAPGSPIVSMSSVSKQFGSQRVLAGLDWQIAPGQVIGLLGRNGAGKSTLLECMLGLREPDRGGVALFGEDVATLSDAARARIGYVPQKTDLFDWLTTDQMLDYFKAMYPRWNTAKVEGLLSRWGFDAAMRAKPIKKLSGGEQQRLAIVRALAHDPDLLVLDEPVSALDPVGRRDFLRELVDQVIERGTTVVFSTHILTDLERVAFDLAFLRDGRIALQGQLDTLLEGARRVVAPSMALPAAPLDGEIGRRHENGLTSIVVQGAGAQVDFLAREPGVRVEPLGLEDLFIEITRESGQMMLAAVHDYRRIWDVAAVRRMPGLFKFLGGLLLLTLATAFVLDRMGDTIGLPAHFGVAGTGRAVLVVSGAVADLLWATVFMPGSILLNSAANARLLPRQRRRLREMAVGGWVLGNLALALGAGLPGMFPLAALWSLAMGLGAAGQRWAMPVSMFLPVLSAPALAQLPQPVRDTLASPAGAFAAGALVVALGWHLLRAQYGDGGDRLLERAEALAQQARRMESKGEVKESALTSWSYRFAYLPALQRACRRRDPSALLLHAMGQWSHWSMVGSLTIIGMVTMAFVVFVPQLAKGVQPEEGKFAGAALIMLALIPVAVAFSTFPLRQQIGKRQGEQALLRLAPLTGNAALLNHRLADGLLKAGAQHWLILSVPFCLLALALGGAEALARELALCCLGGQVAMGAVIDDFSRPPGRGWLWWLVGLAAAELAVTVGLGAWLGFYGWPWLAALSIVAGAFQTWQGWRRLQSAPPAFPALRFDAPVEAAK